jgi:hypothetical protein
VRASAPISHSGLCKCGCGQATTTAQRNEYRRGHVKGRPVTYVQGHNGRCSGPQYTEQDTGFMTPCWLWNFGKTSAGYGETTAAGRPWLAHRLYWQREHGDIPKGLELDHLCRMRACVRPSHLEPVSQAENARRGAGTRLTAEQVSFIIGNPEIRGSDLARRFGVSPSTICDIRHGRKWRNAS